MERLMPNNGGSPTLEITGRASSPSPESGWCAGSSAFGLTMQVGRTALSIQIQAAEPGPILNEPSAESTLFAVLTDWWHRDTDASSITRDHMQHPAVEVLRQRGAAALPFILADLRDRGGHWFPLLRELAAEDAPEEPREGGVRAVRNAWLEWGARQRLI